MKRRSFILLACILALVAGCFFWQDIALWFLRPSLPRPRSDVPITADVGWWPYQDGLTIKELTAEAPHPRLNLFNARFLMRYRLIGAVTYQKGWRPKIARVQITSRLVCRDSSPKPSTADVLLVPVVEVTQDRSYAQEPVPFNIKLEQVVHAMDWGKNVYEIHCLGSTATVSVQQYK